MIDKKTTLIIALMVALVAVTGAFLVAGNSADGETYFMDGDIRYVVTDEANLTVSVAPLEEGKYVAAVSLVIPTTATDGVKTYKVTGIADKTFAFATGLYGVEIPEGIETIGVEAFHYAAIYQDLVLPSTVKEIKEQCFYSSSITGLDLSKTSITVIPEYAFDDCKYLKWVKMNDDVVTIEKAGFGAEITLNSFDFGGSPVKIIGEKAFQNTGTGIELNLPGTLETIGADAFSNAKVTKYTIGDGCKAYKSVDGCILNGAGDTLVYYPLSSPADYFAVPAGVTKLADDSFYGAPNLTTLRIDNSTIIEGYALTMTKVNTLIIEQSAALPEGNKGIIGTYMTAENGYWSMSNITIQHAVIDSEYAIDLTGLMGKNGEYMDFTEKSVNTVGGNFTKDGAPVSSADRAGCRFTCTSSQASDEFTFDNTRFLTVTVDPKEGGTVEGAGSVEIGVETTLKAVPKDGYAFGYWNDDVTLTDPEYKLSITTDTVVKATFLIQENTFFTVPSTAEFKMTMYTGTGPENARASSYNYYNFTPVDYSSKKDNGDGTVTYCYKLVNGTYGAIVTGEGYVTYKDLFSKTANKEYSRTVTLETLMPEGKSAEYVERTVQVKCGGDDVPGMLVSLSKQNYLNLSVGQQINFMAYRHWQAVGNTMQNPFLEPPIVYKITDLNGKEVNDVLDIIEGGASETTYKLKALKEGTVVVTMYMQAFTLNVTQDTFYGATWPELTEVFVITVGNSGSFDTGMQIEDNGSYRPVDAEVDIFYYDHNTEGYVFEFQPAAGTSVSVLNPVLGEIGITGFKEGKVSEKDGVWSVVLTEGRNIVKMTNGSTTLYQVLTALPVVIEVNGQDLKDASVNPGEEAKIVFKSTHGDYGGILNSKGKLAGIYNSNATIYYVDDDGNRIATARQPAYGHYFFVTDMNYQTLTLTVPADYKDDTFDIHSKGILLGGFDGLGDHRTWFLTNAVSLGVKYAARLPEIAVPVAVPPVNYGVKNSTGVDVTLSFYDGETLIDEKSIIAGATETFELKSGTYDIVTSIGEKVLDIRSMTIEADWTTTITSVNVNTNGIDPEAAGLFTVEYTHSNPRYEISTAVTNMDGNEADETNMTVKIFEFDGDTVVADLIPTDAAEGKFAEFINAYTSPANITLNCYKTVSRTILVPAGADVFIGMKVAHFRAFKEVAPASVTTEGDKDVYTFNLASKQVYALTVDVPTNDNLITLGAKITFNSDEFTTLDVVESGLMVAEGKTSKTVVDKPTVNNEVSDIYGNVGATGAMYLDVGESANVDTFRVWQALDSITSNYFIEPVYTFAVVSGNDVISIENGTVTALKEGVAFVAVSYDAMNFLEITSKDLKTPTFYPASNAKNAYVFAVVVGGDEPEFDTGMVINSGLNTEKTKLSVDYIDSDVDFIYYAGDECTYTFTTDKSAEVSVYNPVLSSNTVTGFNDGTVTGSSGTFTVTLTEGRNIIKVTVGGETAYQVVRAQKIDVTVVNKTSEERSAAGSALPGDTLEITIGGLYGLQKLAGTYNPQSDGIIITDEFGGIYAVNASKQYGISTQTLTLDVTVPEGVEDAYVIGGYVVTGGYGDPVGGHHLITRENGRQPNFVAEFVRAYLGSIQGISVPVMDYYSVDFRTPLLVESVVTNENQVKLGSSYNFGTVTLVGGDLYFYLNCANYTLISAEFGHSGSTTKDMYLNTEDLEINGISIPAGRAVVAKGLGSGTFWFKVTYGNAWNSAVFEGTAKLDTGTYCFTQSVQKGEMMVLPELTVEAKYAAQKEKLKFGGWNYDGKTYQPGDKVEITSDCDISAVFNEDFIIFDGDTGTYTDSEGVVTEFATLNDAVKSTTITADILITGDCSFTGSITLKRNLIIADGGVLNANGSLSIAKGYTLTVEDGAELHNGTSQLSNSGTLVIDGIADTRGNFSNSGTLEGTVTALPYFLVGDTLTFSAGRGSIEHTPGQDKCKYDADSKVTITLTVENLPSAVNNGWDDYGTLKVTDIQFSDKSDLVYILSYSIGKVTVLGETILSFYKVTGIDDSVVQKINQRGGMNVVLPQALRDVLFDRSVTIVDEAYYTDTHGSKVYYSVDETTPAYMNGFTTYTLYSYQKENPDYRFCEQGTVTHVEYAEGMTTYDTKMSPWSVNDMTSCDYWVSGSFADMIGTALTYGLEFYGDNVTYSVDSLRAATNAVITIDGTKLYVNAYEVIATPATPEEKYKFLGWNVESGTAVTGDMRIQAIVDEIPESITVKLVAQDGLLINGHRTVTCSAQYGDIVTVAGDKLMLNGETYIASVSYETGYTIKFDQWSGVPEDGKLRADVTITAECTKTPDLRYVTLVAGKNCADVNGLSKLTLEIPYGTRVAANGPVIYFGSESYAAHSASSEGYVYTFDSWVGIPASGEITDDAAITANFADPVKQCIVTFVAGDHGSVSASKAVVGAGSAITFVDNVITIGGYPFMAYPEPSSEYQTVTFDHWDIPGSAKTVTGDMTIEAVFKVTYTPKQIDGSVNVDVSGTGDAEDAIRMPSGTKSVTVSYGAGLSVLINDESLAGKELVTSMVPVNDGSGAAYELIVKVNGQEYNGKMLVTVPAEYNDGKVPVVYYVDGSNQTKMETVSYTDSSITFSTNHNSKYVLQYENAPDNTMLYIVLAVFAIVLIAIIVVSIVRNSRRS